MSELSLTSFSSEEFTRASATVYRHMAATPQYEWPSLRRALGSKIWVKHENHGPTGAFKLRGGLTFVESLRARDPSVHSICSATRGNHGQSLAYAATVHGLNSLMVVPHGNSVEKNLAMECFGARLVEHGDSYDTARAHAKALSEAPGWCFVPSLDRDLVAGVSTYWLEFFSAMVSAGAEPDVVFIPLGQGSGFCAAVAAREFLGLDCHLIGVVSDHAPSFKVSLEQGNVVAVPSTTQLADGLACMEADPAALEVLRQYAEEVVSVTDSEVAQAMRLLFSHTHNVAEGAGAAALAAAMKNRARLAGKVLGIPLTGGNVDSEKFASILTSRRMATLGSA